MGSFSLATVLPQSLKLPPDPAATLVFMGSSIQWCGRMRSGYKPHPAYQLLTIFLFPQAQVRLKGAGLGAKGSAYGLSGADSYKDAVRKAMFARFTEME